MAFLNIQNFTVAIAEDVNDNFYHVAQGAVTPKGGALLGNTTSVYDIGSSTYHFKNGYVSNINALSTTANADGINLIWQLLTEVYPTTNRVAITGLNGDSVFSYRILVYFSYDAATLMSCYMYMNGDSATANYSSTFVKFYVTAFGPTTSARAPIVATFETTTARVAFGKCEMNTKTGQLRTCRIDKSVGAVNATVADFYEEYCRWSNTTSTLTSLVFQWQTIPTYAHIAIWRLG